MQVDCICNNFLDRVTKLTIKYRKAGELVSLSAQDILKQASLKSTPLRRRLLSVMIEAEKPLSSAALHEQIGDLADESTLFRNLKTFEDVGIICQAAWADKTTLYELKDGHHQHYVMCRDCKEIIPLDMCGMKPLLDKAKTLGFSNLSHKLEIQGLCESCK